VYVDNINGSRLYLEKASVRLKKLLLKTEIVNSLQFYLPMSQLPAESALLVPWRGWLAASWKIGFPALWTSVLGKPAGFGSSRKLFSVKIGLLGNG